MKISNKSAGTQFEKDFAVRLAAEGFWVHLFQDNKNGQPCDMVAARNGITYLIDCKDCQGDFFELRRMEENQLNAMRMFEMTGNSRGKFAIRFASGKIFLVDYWQLEISRNNGMKRIDRAGCELFGFDLERWLRHCGRQEGGEKIASCDWQ